MPSELEDLVGFINHGSTPVRQLGMHIPHNFAHDFTDDLHGSCREFGAVFFEPAGDIQDEWLITSKTSQTFG
jgi:hypothetical protein